MLGKGFVSDAKLLSRSHLRQGESDDGLPCSRVALACHPRLPLYMEDHLA